MARDGKLVIRPDSGDPVTIVTGYLDYDGVPKEELYNFLEVNKDEEPAAKGVVELLWDIFGGTVNEQGYKVLDSHIGAIYGDSINLERQKAIYERLEAKGFACTNIVLGVGSFTYQYNTRDTFGFAAKGAWFEVEEKIHGRDFEKTHKVGYNIYKDPITDDGTKKSAKGLMRVELENGEYVVHDQQSPEQERGGELRVVFEDGKVFNQESLDTIRARTLKH